MLPVKREPSMAIRSGHSDLLYGRTALVLITKGQCAQEDHLNSNAQGTVWNPLFTTMATWRKWPLST
jgi:hypothetical protein